MKIDKQFNGILNGIGNSLKFNNVHIVVWGDQLKKFGLFKKFNYIFLFRFYIDYLVPYFKENNSIRNWVGEEIPDSLVEDRDIVKLMLRVKDVSKIVDMVGTKRISTIEGSVVEEIIKYKYAFLENLENLETFIKLTINRLNDGQLHSIIQTASAEYGEKLINLILKTKKNFSSDIIEMIFHYGKIVNPTVTCKTIIKKNKEILDFTMLYKLLSDTTHRLINDNSRDEVEKQLNNLLKFVFKEVPQLNGKEKVDLIKRFGSNEDKISLWLSHGELTNELIHVILMHSKDKSGMVNTILTKTKLIDTLFLSDPVIEKLISVSKNPEETADKILIYGKFKNISNFCWDDDLICPGFSLLLKYCSTENKERLIKEMLKYSKSMSYKAKLRLNQLLPNTNLNNDINKNIVDQMDDSDIHYLISNSKNPQHISKKIITHKKGYLSNNNVMDLLLYTPNTNSIGKLIGQDKINKLSDQDIEELIYNAVDPHIENTLAKFIGSDKIKNIIKGNLEPINESTVSNEEKLKSYLINRLKDKLEGDFGKNIDYMVKDSFEITNKFIYQIKHPKLVYETFLDFIKNHGVNSLNHYMEYNKSYTKLPIKIKKVFLETIGEYIMEEKISWIFTDRTDKADTQLCIDILSATHNQSFLDYIYSSFIGHTNTQTLINSLIKHKSLLKMNTYVEMVLNSIDRNLNYLNLEKMLKSPSSTELAKIFPLIFNPSIPKIIEDHITNKLKSLSFKEQFHIYMSFDALKRKGLLNYLTKLGDKPYWFVGNFQGYGYYKMALIKDKKTGKYGYINNLGEVTVKPIFDSISAWNGNMAAKGMIGNKVYLIFSDGRTIDNETKVPLDI